MDEELEEEKSTSKAEKNVTIWDFVIPEKAAAFITHYAPCKHEWQSDEVFTDEKLRRYFQAYPKACGDVLQAYIHILSEKGYRMGTSASGEPAYFVKVRAAEPDGGNEFLELIASEKGEDEELPLLIQ